MIIHDIYRTGTYVREFFAQMKKKLACKKVDMIKSYISRSNVH
jgi:hypothetical protein